MKRSTTENLASAVDPVMDGVVTIGHSPRGLIELPQEVYRTIAPDLPLCLQRGDNDRSSAPHLDDRFLRTESDGWVTLRTRNLFLIVMLLMKHGVKYVLRPRFESVACICRDTFGAAANSVLETVPSPIQKLGEFVDSNLAGMIVTRDQRQTFDAIAALCGMFPVAPIALLAASHAEADLIASEVGKRVPDTVGRAQGLQAVFQPGITVVTYHAWRSMYFWGVPFLIVPIWKAGYPLWLKQATWNPYLDRAYFFRTANESLSEREADDVEGRLGPCFSLVEGKCRRPIQNRYFSTYQFGGAASRQRDRTSPPISREPIDCQKFYWRHRRRNQALAALARNLGETNESVAVLTENLAHAEALSRLLRDWVLAKKGAVPEKMPQRMIVTLSAADTWKEFCPATVINAAGGFHSPWLLDWAEQMSQSGSSIRIVDLTDGFDETASRLAAGRLEAYREAGWHWRPLENSVVRAVGRSLRSAQIAKESV